VRQSHRQGLARQRRGVDEGRLRGHRAVHRHHVALPDQQAIAGRDVVEGHLLQPAVAVPGGRPRNARQEIAHRPARAALCEGLEEGAAGIHHRDDRRGEALAEDQRRRHRQGGDDIEAHLAGAQAAEDLDHERGQRGNDAGDPDEARNVGSARETRTASPGIRPVAAMSRMRS
jgi:hypothetical protein